MPHLTFLAFGKIILTTPFLTVGVAPSTFMGPSKKKEGFFEASQRAQNTLIYPPNWLLTFSFLEGEEDEGGSLARSPC